MMLKVKERANWTRMELSSCCIQSRCGLKAYQRKKAIERKIIANEYANNRYSPLVKRPALEQYRQ